MSEPSTLKQIQAQLTESQASLADLYRQALQETLFTSRGQIRPASLKRIAATEVESMLDFCQNPDPARGRQRGAQLCQIGLGKDAILRLGQTTRQFYLTHLPEKLYVPAIDIAESYHNALMQGFIQTNITIVLEEQERIRIALQRALGRATIQMEVAADIAQSATSILDLNKLLGTSVELICDRFDFYYVSIFLVDDYKGWAILRAGSGQAGQEMLRRGHKLQIGGNSMVGQCIEHRQSRIVQDIETEAVRLDNPLLPQTRSEIALPLISRDRVIGAMNIQSSQTAAFSQQDVVALYILIDQLANAIENSRLFADLQASLAEAQATQRRYVRETWPEAAHLQPGYLYEQSTDSFLAADKLGWPKVEQAIEETLAMPIMLRSEIIGMLDLYDTTESRQWSEEDMELVSAVMAQAALTIDNARLFEETAQHAHTTAVIQQITATINISEDLVAGLPAIIEHLRGLVPVDAASLTTYTQGAPEFRHFAIATQSTEHPTQRGTWRPLKGSGPGWVIAHKEPWRATDLRQEKTFDEDEQFVAEGLVSRLLLPLQIGTRIVGTLNLASTQPGAFTEEHIPILSQIADQMALALERAHLLEETQAALAEVEAAHRRYLREQWEGLLSSTSDRTWGYMDSPDGLTPITSAPLGETEQIEEFWSLEIEKAIATSKLATVIEPIQPQDESTSPPTQHSGLAMPIRLRGQTIGVLDFYDDEGKRFWTQDDKALVDALADQIAQTLETHRLFEQTQRRAYREHLTSDIVGKIRAAGDIHSILETAAEELGRALGVSRAVVRLSGPPDGDHLADENSAR